MKRNRSINEAIKQVKAGRNVFITGRAGTGKSTLLSHIVSGSPPGTGVVAPTGVAALNVGGQTIHRFFGFPVSVTPEDVRTGAIRPRRDLGYIGQLKRLIIDEVSMVRADLMDCVDVALRKWGPSQSLPFGGVQMVFVGDPYQLPPVVTRGERAYFTDRYATPYFFSSDAFAKLEYAVVELTEVFRQQDTGFINVLNAVRDNTVSQEQLELLNTRVDPAFRPLAKEFFITLASTRALAAAVNEERLDKLRGRLYSNTAEVTGRMSEYPTAVELQFKENAQVMMLTNDPAGRWVNGSLGVIKAVDMSEPSVQVRIVDSGMVVDVEQHEWTMTRPLVRDGNLAFAGAGTFRQFPFGLAWAVTIHKSQGKSFDQVIVDLGRSTFAEGQLYVALSRCRSLDGLVLRRPIRPGDIKVHPTVTSFLTPKGRAATREPSAPPAPVVRHASRRARKPATKSPQRDAVSRVNVQRLPRGRPVDSYSHIKLRAVVRHLDPDGTATRGALIDGVCKFLGYTGRSTRRTELISRAITAEARLRPVATAGTARKPRKKSAGKDAASRTRIRQLPRGRPVDSYSHAELRAVVRHLDPDGTAARAALIDGVCQFLGYSRRSPRRTELISRAISAERRKKL